MKRRRCKSAAFFVWIVFSWILYARVALRTRRVYIDRWMILSFADRDSEALFNGRFARRLPSDIQRAAHRKLRQLHQAVLLRDLAAPPDNCLEALRSGRLGQHSIRVNDQWRICFVWTDAGVEQAEIVDYHMG